MRARLACGEAGVALATWGNCAHQHTVTRLVALESRAELADDAYQFMADDESRFHRVLAPEDAQERMVHFIHCSPLVQQSVARRFIGGATP